MRPTRLLPAPFRAVTIDWTVMVAAAFGVGVLSAAIVQTALSHMGTEIGLDFGPPALMAPNEQLISFEDFDSAAPDWVGGQVDRSEAAFGGILGRFGGTEGRQTVWRDFAIPSGARYAIAEFDLHAIDTWDLEELRIFVDDELAASHSFSTDPQLAAAAQARVSGGANLSVRFAPYPNSGQERGFMASRGAYSADETWRVQVVVADPGASLRIGFGSTLDEPIQNESWAIDNFSLRVTQTAPQ